MIDWNSSMTKTYEYYVVDPDTWKDTKKLDVVKSCSITRDIEAETLGSASIDITELVGECYIRVYLVAIQNGITEKHPLGTFLVQTPSSTFNGKVRTVTMDAYTPLLELKEKYPPIGYSLLKGTDIMDIAYRSVRELARAPVVKTECSDQDYAYLLDNFVSNPSESWMIFLRDLISNAKYMFDLDEMSRIIFAPKQDTTTLQPVFTFTDDNSSILLPELTMDHDLYGIPNVVEVVCSNGSTNHYARVVNDDPNSPTSTVSRGREIVHRETSPDLIGNNPSVKQIESYAENLLKEMSTVEYTITYTHGYHPRVRPGVCVCLDYARAGISSVKAKVISQTIKCTPSGLVTEKAIFTNKLWR
jgi:hypothetical protein